MAYENSTRETGHVEIRSALGMSDVPRTLTQLYVYPIKSSGGIAVRESVLAALLLAPAEARARGVHDRLAVDAEVRSQRGASVGATKTVCA